MVERIQRDHPQPSDTVQALSFDEMYATAKRMFTAREEFRRPGKPIQVQLRYHYTPQEHVASIRKHGLLNNAEYTGNCFGPGIESICLSWRVW
jgi:hypothetical protein